MTWQDSKPLGVGPRWVCDGCALLRLGDPVKTRQMSVHHQPWRGIHRQDRLLPEREREVHYCALPECQARCEERDAAEVREALTPSPNWADAYGGFNPATDTLDDFK